MAKLLVYAGVMELQSIELEVCLRKSPLLIADLGVIFGLAGCGLAALSNGFQRYPGPDHGYARKGQTGGNDGRPVRHRPYGQYGEASHRKDSYAARQANIPATREAGAATGEAPENSLLPWLLQRLMPLAADGDIASDAGRAARGVRLPASGALGDDRSNPRNGLLPNGTAMIPTPSQNPPSSLPLPPAFCDGRSGAPNLEACSPLGRVCINSNGVLNHTGRARGRAGAGPGGRGAGLLHPTKFINGGICCGVCGAVRN